MFERAKTVLIASKAAAVASLRGNHTTPTRARYKDLTASYRALHDAYWRREELFAAVAADRTD